MSDFAQTGLICTLQRLNDTHLARIEIELTDLAAARPIALVLPCHGRDLAQPAFTHLLEELRGAAFLREIVFSVNGVEPDEMGPLSTRLGQLPQRTTLLHNDALPAQAA